MDENFKRKLKFLSIPTSPPGSLQQQDSTMEIQILLLSNTRSGKYWGLFDQRKDESFPTFQQISWIMESDSSNIIAWVLQNDNIPWKFHYFLKEIRSVFLYSSGVQAYQLLFLQLSKGLIELFLSLVLDVLCFVECFGLKYKAFIVVLLVVSVLFLNISSATDQKSK